MQLDNSIHYKPLRAPIVKGLFYCTQDTQKPKGHERLLPFVTTYHPAVKILKRILMEHLSLIHNQPFLKTIFTKPPIISYKKGKFL